MATPLSSRSTTGDSAEGLFVSALANCRRSLLRVCARAHARVHMCASASQVQLRMQQLSAIDLNQLQ